MDAFIATILPAGFNFSPYGWQLCWGQQLAVSQNQAVFALVNTYYGGNGATTFNLPDLRGRVPIGWGTHNTFSYAMGATSGSDLHTMTMSEMPAHNHAAIFTPITSDVTTKTTAISGDQTVSAKVEISTGTASTNVTTAGVSLAAGSATTKIYSSTSASPVALGGVSASLEGSPSIPAMDITLPNVVTGGSVAISATGGNTPIDIRPSSQAINFIFCMNGIFPTRG